MKRTLIIAAALTLGPLQSCGILPLFVVTRSARAADKGGPGPGDRGSFGLRGNALSDVGGGC